MGFSLDIDGLELPSEKLADLLTAELSGGALSRLFGDNNLRQFRDNTAAKPEDHQVRVQLSVDGNTSELTDWFSFKVFGEANASATIDASPDLPSYSAQGVELGGDASVVVSFSGQVQAKVDGSLSASSTSYSAIAGVGAYFQATSELHYVTSHPEGMQARTASVDAIKGLPAPWDLADIDESGETKGIIFKNSNILGGGVSVALARGLQIASLETKVALSAKAQFAFAGTHDLSVMRRKDGKFSLKIKRERQQSDTFSGGLNVVVDLSELSKKALEFTAQIQGKAAPLLEMLDEKKLLRPGTMLRSEIVDIVDELVRDQQLIKVAQLVLGEAGGQETIASELQNLLVAAVDLNPALTFEKNLTEEVGDLIEGLFDQAAVPALAKRLEKYLLPEMASVLGDFAQRAQEELQFILVDIADPLAQLAAHIDQTAEDVDGRFEVVRDQVQKYAVLLKNLKETVSDAANKKVDLSIAVQAADSDGREVVAKIVVDPKVEQAVGFYRSLSLGDVSQLSDLIDENVPNIPGVHLESGSINDWVKKVRTSELGLILFGDNAFSSVGTASAEARWIVSRNGNITVRSLESEAFAEAIWKNDEEKKVARFDDTAQLAIAPVGTGANWTGSFDLTYDDKRLTTNEFQNLLTQLRDSELVGTDRAAFLVAQYRKLQGGNPAIAPKSRFAAGLKLSASAFERLLGAESHGASHDWFPARLEFARQLIDKASLDNVAMTSNYTKQLSVWLNVEDDFAHIIAALSKIYDGSEADLEGYGFSRVLDKALQIGFRREPVLRAVRQVRGFGEALDNLQRAYQLEITEDDWSDRQQLRDWLVRRQKKVAEGLKKGISVGDHKKPLTGEDAFSDITLALVFTIAKLSGISPKEHFSVSLDALPKEKKS